MSEFMSNGQEISWATIKDLPWPDWSSFGLRECGYILFLLIQKVKELEELEEQGDEHNA
jgi:hypothetical protein